jgi:hypothetical protein
MERFPWGVENACLLDVEGQIVVATNNSNVTTCPESIAKDEDWRDGCKFLPHESSQVCKQAQSPAIFE